MSTGCANCGHAEAMRGRWYACGVLPERCEGCFHSSKGKMIPVGETEIVKRIVDNWYPEGTISADEAERVGGHGEMRAWIFRGGSAFAGIIVLE